MTSGNLQTALDLKVDRVGHALELIKDEELMAKSVSFDDNAMAAVGVLNGSRAGLQCVHATVPVFIVCLQARLAGNAFVSQVH